MCNIWQSKEWNEISPELLANLPKNIKDVNLTGGEPFLYSDLPGAVRAISGRLPKARIIISTNGFLTGRITEAMKKIIKIKPDIGAAVSLDGIGRAHDEIRGIPGGFEMALTTIKELKKIGVKHLKIGFTIGDYNYKELPKVYALSKELGTEFTIALVHSSESYFQKENATHKKNEIREILEWLKHEELRSWYPKRWARAYFTHGLIEFLDYEKRILPDYSGQLNIFIDPAGKIFPCDVSGEDLGSLADNPLKWRSIGVCTAGEKSWMICTARQSMKKHWVKAGSWIIFNKFRSLTGVNPV
jgi:MoaA/NifB/PqqE/SkfB family radical SAM enzyme